MLYTLSIRVNNGKQYEQSHNGHHNGHQNFLSSRRTEELTLCLETPTRHICCSAIPKAETAVEACMPWEFHHAFTSKHGRYPLWNLSWTLKWTCFHLRSHKPTWRMLCQVHGRQTDDKHDVILLV